MAASEPEVFIFPLADMTAILLPPYFQGPASHEPIDDTTACNRKLDMQDGDCQTGNTYISAYL